MGMNTQCQPNVDSQPTAEAAQVVATALRFGSASTLEWLTKVLQAAPAELLEGLRTEAIKAVSSGSPGTYSVLWAIDIEEVDSPLEAADHARECQVREGTTATVFEVLDLASGGVSTIDLDLTEQPVATIPIAALAAHVH